MPTVLVTTGNLI